MNQCPFCKEDTYDWLCHTCPPSWFVWRGGEEPTGETDYLIYAKNEEKAIEKYLAPSLDDQFDNEERIICVLSGNSSYFDDKEELSSIKETLSDIEEALKEGNFLEYYDEGDKQFYENKAQKLADSIKSESSKIKQYNVQPYMTWMLECEQITDD
jgi:hypothetical protein